MGLMQAIKKKFTQIEAAKTAADLSQQMGSMTVTAPVSRPAAAAAATTSAPATGANKDEAERIVRAACEEGGATDEELAKYLKDMKRDRIRTKK